jgi:hypothetical protein
MATAVEAVTGLVHENNDAAAATHSRAVAGGMSGMGGMGGTMFAGLDVSPVPLGGPLVVSSAAAAAPAPAPAAAAAAAASSPGGVEAVGHPVGGDLFSGLDVSFGTPGSGTGPSAAPARAGTGAGATTPAQAPAHESSTTVSGAEATAVNPKP